MNKAKSDGQWDYALGMFGIVLIGAIILFPIDRNQVLNDLEGQGDFARWYANDCGKINADIEASGGMIPYYFNRVRQNREWQYEYRTGRTRENKQNWRHNYERPGREEYDYRRDEFYDWQVRR